MRRQSTSRHQPRPSFALSPDDLTMLREGDENNDGVLRRQLIEKDRENDRLQTQIQILQAQLAQRPPMEHIQELEKEYKNLDLLLQGTQRENERCMAELDRGKQREKMLEQALAKVAGENWQSSLDIAPAVNITRLGHGRSNTISGSPLSATSPAVFSPISGSPEPQESRPDRQQVLAHIEQVRLLILGMEQRLQTREDKLSKVIDRAEGEGQKFEQYRKEISTGRD